MYLWSVSDFENSRRHNSASLTKGPMESRKRATCSFVLPLRPSSFWSLALYTLEGIILQSLYQDKVASNLEKLTVEAFFFSRLNMASNSAFIINMVGFPNKLAGCRAIKRLSALVGVTPKTGSLRTGSIVAEAGTETGPQLV